MVLGIGIAHVPPNGIQQPDGDSVATAPVALVAGLAEKVVAGPEQSQCSGLFFLGGSGLRFEEFYAAHVVLSVTVITLHPFSTQVNNYFSTHLPLLGYTLAMKSIEQKRKQVQKLLKIRRKRLIKQGLCRDCGLNPAAHNRTDTRKRKPTLCEACRTKRRDQARRRREKAA